MERERDGDVCIEKEGYSQAYLLLIDSEISET